MLIPKIILLQESESEGMESQTEGDLSDLADLSVHAVTGSADIKKEPGKSGSGINALHTLVAKQHKILESVKEVRLKKFILKGLGKYYTFENQIKYQENILDMLS